MHQAAACGNADCVKSLVAAGGIIDGVDEAGQTPLHLATLWGHRECARILKHHEWLKHKALEDDSKREIIIEQERVEQQAIAAVNKEKAERRLKGQKAYQRWLAKNKFASSKLFGLFDNLVEGAELANTPKRTKLKSRAAKLAGKHALKHDASKDAINGSKRVNLLPINAPASTGASRPAQLDPAKRLPHIPSPVRARAVDRRGALQFPVL